MSVTLRTATATDVGLVRSNNEDSAYAGRRMAALADGIGGAPSGELASEIAVRTLAELDGIARGLRTGEEARAALIGAVELANQRIAEQSGADVANDGMGTTLTALLLAGDEIALVHVGDSRGYLLRQGAFAQLTKDDTFVQSLVDEGLITAAQARIHPRRSLVTQALQGLDYHPATAIFRATQGDRYLLCSDGLSDVVTDESMATALSTVSDANKCARKLIGLALAGGAPDNVTVVIADITR